MKSYLLDTCVLSEYVKKKPDKNVINWLDAIHEANLFISVLTLGELQKGAAKQKTINPARHHKLSLWVDTVEQRFSERILVINNEIARIWAKLCGTSESRGIKLPVIDSLLVATAQHHNLEIVTRNVRDDADYPRVFNPWDVG